MRKEHARGAATALAALICTSACYAQLVPGATNPGPKLINIDTEWVPAMNSWSLRGDIRGFGQDEKTLYGSLELNGGFSNGFGVAVRGTVSKFLNLVTPGFTIRHGGSDMEAMLKYAPAQVKGLMVGAGVSLPNTPAQNNAFATAEAMYHAPTTGVDVYLGAKGVFRKDSTLAGICGGFDAHIAQGTDFIGDLTVPVTGHNTYSTSTGAQERHVVYGAALRFTPQMVQMRQNVSFDLGVTNGLGGTTGFSLTSALGNSIGIYAAATIRY